MFSIILYSHFFIIALANIHKMVLEFKKNFVYKVLHNYYGYIKDN